MKLFISHFTIALATASSLSTLISFVFDWKIRNTDGTIDMCLSITFALLIILLCATYAYIQTRSKNKIKLDINASLSLTIQEADIFQQNGIIVIGVNEYFDTYVGDGIISEKSLHGKFIKRYYQNHIEDLDSDIKQSLNEQNIQPCSTNCPRKRAEGKKDKYELGTCALIHDGGKKYVLVALTHFTDNDKAYMSRNELKIVMEKLMIFLDKNAEAEEVHMPILGTGLARLDRSPNRILYYTLDFLDFIIDSSIIGGLYIDIQSLANSKVNLNQIEEHFNNGISKY